MASYLLRCSLPDRPGALGLVASRIGAVRGDITGVEVRRRLAGSVIDEFLIALPAGTGVDLLLAEVSQVDGLRVESCDPVADGGPPARRGGVVWLEILVDDVESAAAYYRDTLGWASEPFGLVGGAGYRLLSPSGGEPPIGALVHSDAATPTQQVAGPVPYVQVPDIQAVLDRTRAAGGQIREPVSPFGEEGRYAIVADRWGNRLGLWSTDDR